MTGRAILDRKVAHAADVLIDPEHTSSAWQQLTGFRAIFAVPLMREGQPIGAMMLSRTTPGTRSRTHSTSSTIFQRYRPN
jgi:GAF domain-containing protein